jgi:hypothetical protein
MYLHAPFTSIIYINQCNIFQIQLQHFQLSSVLKLKHINMYNSVHNETP